MEGTSTTIEMPQYGFFFEVGLSFALHVDVEVSSHAGLPPEQYEIIPPSIDTKEAALSTSSQQLQRQIRKRVRTRLEEQRRSDLESLYLLEAATAANSIEARMKDRESLHILMRHTTLSSKPRQNVQTPAKRSFWPPARYIKGLNGTPLSYEPPFSTPSAVYQREKPGKENEFEAFLCKDALASGHGNVGSKKSRNSFSAILASSKSSNQSFGTTEAERSEYIRKRAKSVSQWMEKVEQQDAEAERALMEDLADAIESPEASPTSQIKQLPRSVSEAAGEIGSVKEDMEDVKDRAVITSPKSEACEGGENQENGSTSDLDDEWETVSIHSY